MAKTEEYLSYIEDSLKLDDGSTDQIHTRLIRIWARLSEYLYYSDVTFEKFNREMGYDHFDIEGASTDDYEEDEVEAEKQSDEEDEIESREESEKEEDE